ncbi:hypothetical protein GCM10027446_32750 [Angustibacter peucedani]
MLGRRSKTDEAPASQTPDGPGKNRPTPKRRDVQAARKQPLVPTARAATGKGGKPTKAARDAARMERIQARERMMAGDERFLGPRDRGPVRRFARDFVDARWNLGELLLPVMVVVLLLSFASSALKQSNPAVYGGVLAVTYVLVVMSAVDAIWMSLRLKKAARAKFGDDLDTKGLTWYSVMRAFQMRRTRVPRAVVKRGEFPV